MEHIIEAACAECGLAPEALLTGGKPAADARMAVLFLNRNLRRPHLYEPIPGLGLPARSHGGLHRRIVERMRKDEGFVLLLLRIIDRLELRLADVTLR